MLQASQFNNVLGTNRRKMPRRLCRLKSRTWETTTSASWRNPTAPPPSSRSSPSGCSTPSTWTESRPPAARLQVLDHYGSGSATQSKFSPARKQKNMFIWKNKNKTQLELSTLVSGFYKPVPNTASPTSLWICGLATTNNDFMAERSQCGNPSQPLPGGMHSLPSNAPVCVHVMGCWFSCMANDKDVETHPKEMGFKLSG